MLIAKLGLTTFHPDPRLGLPSVSRQPQGGEVGGRGGERGRGRGLKGGQRGQGVGGGD